MVIPGKTAEPKVLIVQSAADAPVRVWQAVANCAGVKGWLDRAVRLFTDKPKGFGNAQVGLYDLRMAEGDHLAACVQMLRKALDR